MPSACYWKLVECSSRHSNFNIFKNVYIYCRLFLHFSFQQCWIPFSCTNCWSVFQFQMFNVDGRRMFVPNLFMEDNMVNLTKFDQNFVCKVCRDVRMLKLRIQVLTVWSNTKVYFEEKIAQFISQPKSSNH